MNSQLTQTTYLSTGWQEFSRTHIVPDENARHLSDLYKYYEEFWKAFPHPEQLYLSAIRKPAFTSAWIGYKLWQLVKPSILNPIEKEIKRQKGISNEY